MSGRLPPLPRVPGVTQTVLLLRCPDRPGIVAAVGQTIAALGGNIIHADQHTDRVHGLFVDMVKEASS